MKFSKTLFLLVGITVLLETSARAQATLSFETAIRPLGSKLTNSEGNQIDADAFQMPTGLAFSNDGLKVFAETCPQYLFLTAQDLDLEGVEGAKFCCSPPPRDEIDQKAMWRGLTNGTFQLFSSDHAPYRFDETGKLHAGPNPTFKKIANGVPGIELRMPLLFSEGVSKGRININEFVALTSTNAAKIYGLNPKKGTIAVGSDADIGIWDPDREVKVEYKMLHDNVGYTPYEGMDLKGWPEIVISRGRIVVKENELRVKPGSGKFLKRTPGYDYIKPQENLVIETDQNKNFGANLI